jgi:glucans biosynthesis protein C
MHQTVIVVIGYYVIQCSWTPWIKYFVVLALSMSACVVLYEGCVRRFAALGLVFGMKVESASLSLVSAPDRGAVRNDIRAAKKDGGRGIRLAELMT